MKTTQKGQFFSRRNISGRIFLFVLMITAVILYSHSNYSYAASFTTELGIGSSGQEVTDLQNVLISDAYLLVPAPTGYFGSLTSSAVMNYQQAHGINATGYVGPLTLSSLNGGGSTNATLIATLTAELHTLEAELAALLGQQGGGGGGGGYGGGGGGGTAPAPTCAFSASPATINSGQTATLSWNTTNASSASISPTVGSVAVSGSQSVTPAFTSVYTLTASGPGGSVNCTATVTITSSPPPSQPLGFASLGSGTTGGTGGSTCHASDVPSLRSCVGSANPSIVVFDVPSITLSATDQPILISSNKTIQGPVSLSGPGRILMINGTNNIIIKGITFSTIPGETNNTSGAVCQNPYPETPNTSEVSVDGCGVPLEIHGGSTSNSNNVWIDHNLFSECGDKCITDSVGLSGIAQDGTYYAGDLISITNNIFKDSYYAVLVTVDGPARAYYTTRESIPATRLMRVTVADNLFTSVVRRSPRGAYTPALLHVFNNAINYWGERTACEGNNDNAFGFGPSSTNGAQMYLENNSMTAWLESDACKEAVNTIDGSAGFLKSVGNLLLNAATATENNPSAVFNPHTYYSYTPLPAAAVLQSVQAHAGPAHS